jgi:hypothetical protein
MTGGTGVHGLPAEYHTPAGEREDWEAALGYLQALEKSRSPIVMAIIDLRLGELNPGYTVRLTEQIGFLRRLPDHGDRTTIHRFAVNWPDRDQSCGVLTLDERLFEGARLGTNDGDDYFALTLDLMAKDMTDAELAAAGERVSWRLRTSGRMRDVPHTEYRTLWLDEFAANLREGGG